MTRGSIAPFARPAGGALNVELPDQPAHFLYLHDVDSRIRGDLDGVTVADTVGGRMLHETGLLPRWYLPRADVREDLLEPSATVTHCPFKGDARYWHLRLGDRVVEDAFWEYPAPLPGCPDLRGLLSPYLDHWGRWLEEDDEVVGHPRDPFHRVDILPSSREVTVSAAGAVVARSRRSLAVTETGMPVRWYLPAEDVDASVLEASDTHTVCPYKGTASYWSLKAGEHLLTDVVWSYEEPLAPAAALAGRRSFLGDGIEVVVSRT